MNRNITGAVLAAAMSAIATAAPAQDAAQSHWATRCSAESRQAEADCQMEQTVVAQETGQQLARMVVAVAGSGRDHPEMQILLPLGIDLAAEIRLQVDETPPKSFRLRVCEAVGCILRAPLEAELLDLLRKGNILNARFSNLAGEDLAIGFSLSGFSAAYEAIR